MAYCAKRRAMLIVDPPAAWGAVKEIAAMRARDGLTGLGLNGTDARNAAIYFPRILQADPLRDNQIDTFVPCGIVAGVMARTDVQRWRLESPGRHRRCSGGHARLASEFERCRERHT